MKLFIIPHQAFPYQKLLDENLRRTRLEPEYELLDTGIFDGDRYLISPRNMPRIHRKIFWCVSVCPTGGLKKQVSIFYLRCGSVIPGVGKIRPDQSYLLCHHKIHLSVLLKLFILSSAIISLLQGAGELLFTDNDTDTQRVFGVPCLSLRQRWYPCLCGVGMKGLLIQIRPAPKCLPYVLKIRRRDTEYSIAFANVKDLKDPFGKNFNDIFEARLKEADEFYRKVVPLTF